MNNETTGVLAARHNRQYIADIATELSHAIGNLNKEIADREKLREALIRARALIQDEAHV